MGRPINKKYFGNRNTGSGSTGNDNGIGGEGVASVTVSGTWTGFTSVTTTVSFSAPELPGGITAAGTAIIDGSGVLTGVLITEKGSGYTSEPTVTIVDSDGGSEVTGSATAVLTSTQENAIAGVAYVQGGSSAVAFDIIKQEASHRYLVKTAQGTGQCKLVATAPAAGEMTIVATDNLGSTYYVTKLTARRAMLTRKTDGGSGYAFQTNDVAGWTLGSASSGVVSIANA